MQSNSMKSNLMNADLWMITLKSKRPKTDILSHLKAEWWLDYLQKKKEVNKQNMY